MNIPLVSDLFSKVETKPPSVKFPEPSGAHRDVSKSAKDSVRQPGGLAFRFTELVPTTSSGD